MIRAEVFEGDSVLGNQEITLNLPDTDDSQSALNCLAEGQINFSKIAANVLSCLGIKVDRDRHLRSVE